MGFLCVDVGATNTLLGCGNGEFDVLEKLPTEEFLEDVEGNIEAVVEDSGKTRKIEEVAAAVAGPIDRDTGVFYPPNIEKERVQIVQPLSSFGDVEIINDCASAVIGEHVYGDHGVENLVYVTISSGIGAGVVVDGSLVEGWNGNFGEVGHLQLSGENLGRGGENTWERICSGNHLPAFAENVTGKEFNNAREIFQLAERGDEDAEKAIRKMKEINSRGFAAIVNCFNPEKIAVGGAVALNHEEVVVEPLESAVAEKAVNRIPEIESCSLREEAVLHGLRAFCNDKH